MSALKGCVGDFEFEFKTIPSGPTGSAHVEVQGRRIEVRWRRDADGLWLELPNGVYGFDLDGEVSDEGGVSYRVTEREHGQIWAGVSFRRAGEQSAAAAAGGAKKGMRVRAQMPGKIIRVMTQVGAVVEKDQPLIVMEAMKMENEIRAPQAGKVGQLKVTEGQAVETGADLCIIDPV